MDRTAIEALLVEPRIMILTANRRGAEPFVAPVWYEFRDGQILIVADAESAKIRLIRRDPAVTLCVQRETLPYKAVVIRGTAAIRIGANRSLIHRIAGRYMSAAEAEDYVRGYAARPGESQASIVVTPSVWRAWDYGEPSGTDRVPWIPDADLR